ncbi:MAG: TIM barrel protein [Candidatus Pacearchaeota archaeon]
MADYENIYPGTTYLLDPNYGNFTGFRIPAGELGGTTSIQTANQLSEVSKLLNQGMKTTEVSLTDMKVFESIPKNQFEEIRRLNELTGAESTLHSPIIDPAGFIGEQGWSKENRELAERQIWNVVERGHELNPNGNIPVTIHAAGMIPGSEMIPDKEQGEVLGRMVAVDRESGKFIPLARETRYYPHHEGKELAEGKIYKPEEELKIANNSYWDNELSQLVFYKDRGDQILRNALPIAAEALTQGIKDPEKLDPREITAINDVNNAQIFLNNTYQSLQGLYNKAYKYADEETRAKLRKVAEEVGPNIRKSMGRDPSGFSSAIQQLIGAMQAVTDQHTPQVYESIEKFTKENASKTLSNVAYKAYEEFGNNAPILSIENPPYGAALASGKDLKDLVIQTREQFVKKLTEEGKSKSEAEKIAEKLIGVTWDTSHIGMIRKQGFGNEKIVEETRHVAPYVKHVHFNDNLGSTHTDLPPGMGNVPLRDVLEVLEEKKFRGKKVFEGGEFFSQFKTSPHPYVLEATGSSIYSTGAGPYWNQIGVPGAYFSGTGAINPPIYHSTWGASFARLPTELGGAMPGSGDTSQFSGTPNQ